MNGRGQRSDAVTTNKLDNGLRFLQQAEETVLPLCGTNGTCPSSACDCRANEDFISDHCAPVINSVCNGYTDADGKEWNVDGCFMYYADYPDRHEYFKTMHCRVSKCFDEGGTYGSCYCQWYDFLCQTYGDKRRYIKDTRALGLCAAAECCQNKTDDDGDERQYNSFAILGLCEVDECCQNKTDEAGVSSGRRFYYPDVGILQGGKSRPNVLMNGRGQRSDAVTTNKLDNGLRFLQQAEETVLPLCGTNGTCPSSACDCRANEDFISDHCAPVINSVCNGYTDADGKEWNVDGCFMYYADYPDRHEYFKTMHCRVSKCFDEGGTYGSCYCQWYDFLCQTYGDKRRYIGIIV
ncbi:hypothetical protein ACHAWU_004695 [Discostella pseudostelligera]|uniref:Uncharacterized protein n=1 Tax=Discostella pseudostelligera TaxID=259834 RepID=A0ABD3NE75_9STRA